MSTPQGYPGTNVVLYQEYFDGSGQPADPTSPLVDILDPDGTVVVNDAVPTRLATGLYTYSFAIPVDAEVSDQWRQRASGVIDGVTKTAEEYFEVLAAGDPTGPGAFPMVVDEVLAPNGAARASTTMAYRAVGSLVGEAPVSDPATVVSIQGLTEDVVDDGLWAQRLRANAPMAPTNNFYRSQSQIKGRTHSTVDFVVPADPPTTALSAPLTIPLSGSFEVPAATDGFLVATSVTPQLLCIGDAVIAYTGMDVGAFTGCTAKRRGAGSFGSGSVVEQAYWRQSLAIDPPVGLPTLLSELVTTLDAQNVKLTGAQTITGDKTVSALTLLRAPTMTGTPLTVQGATGQTADLTSWRTPAGATAAGVSALGLLKLASHSTATLPGASATGIGGTAWSSTYSKPLYSDGTDWLDQYGSPPSAITRFRDLTGNYNGPSFDVVAHGITVGGIYYPPPMDGDPHALSTIPGLTLAAAQVVYPFVTSLTQQRDYCALQLAINRVAPGNRYINPATGLSYPGVDTVPIASIDLGWQLHVGPDTPTITGVLGFRMKGHGAWITSITYTGSGTAAFKIDGCCYGHFSGFSVKGGTPKYGIWYDWRGPVTLQPDAPIRPSSGCIFEGVFISDMAFTDAGWGVGTEWMQAQTDGSTWIGCIVSGGWTAGNTTTYQAGWLIGNGNFGNNYGHSLFGCSVAHTRWAIRVRAASVQVFGFQCGSHESVVRYEAGAAPCSFNTIRAECACLVSATGASSFATQLAFRDCLLNRVGGEALPTRVVDLNGFAGTILMENVRWSNWESTTPVKMRFSAASAPQVASVVMNGVAWPGDESLTPHENLAATVEGTLQTHIVVNNYLQVDAFTEEVLGGVVGPWVLEKGTVVMDPGTGGFLSTPSLRINTTIGTFGAATIIPSSAAEVGLTVKAVTGQSADLLRVLDSANQSVFAITSAGWAHFKANAATVRYAIQPTSTEVRVGTETNHPLWILSNGSVRARYETNGNIGIGNTTTYGSGVGVLAVANCSTAPTAAPSSAALLYAEAGTLKVRGAGNVPNLQSEALGAANTPIVAKGAAGQTASLTEWQDSTGAILSKIGKGGRFGTRVVTAPADADVATSEAQFWFDPTPGAAKLRIKAKDSSGAVVTGSLALA